jgi:hypothetical protein
MADKEKPMDEKLKQPVTSPEPYLFISDPGHGWLAVPSSEVFRLGLRPSKFSYVHEGFHYLEEDCDFVLWAEAKNERGESYRIVEEFQEDTPIRGYLRCCGGEQT